MLPRQYGSTVDTIPLVKHAQRCMYCYCTIYRLSATGRPNDRVVRAVVEGPGQHGFKVSSGAVLSIVRMQMGVAARWGGGCGAGGVLAEAAVVDLEAELKVLVGGWGGRGVGMERVVALSTASTSPPAAASRRPSSSRRVNAAQCRPQRISCPPHTAPRCG